MHRRTWVLSVNIVAMAALALLLLPEASGFSFRPSASAFVQYAPFLVFEFLLLLGSVLERLSSRVAAFLNPFTQILPDLALVLVYAFCRGGDIQLAAAFSLMVVGLPCALVCPVTAYLYWRDIRAGDF